MLCRFAAAAAVASVVIAAAVVVIGLSPVLSFTRVYPLPVIWCVVPLVWGIWALLAPPSWVEERLPLWGAILGFVAGIFAALVLDLPSRVWRVAVPLDLRILGVAALTLLYYFMWIPVEFLYEALEAHSHRARTKTA